MFLRASYMHVEDERYSWGKSRPEMLFLEEEWPLLKKSRTLLAPYKTQLRSQFVRFLEKFSFHLLPLLFAISPSAAPRELRAQRHGSRRSLTRCPPALGGCGARCRGTSWRPTCRAASPPRGLGSPGAAGAAANPPRGRIKRGGGGSPPRRTRPGRSGERSGARRALPWELPRELRGCCWWVLGGLGRAGGTGRDLSGRSRCLRAGARSPPARREWSWYLAAASLQILPACGGRQSSSRSSVEEPRGVFSPPLPQETLVASPNSFFYFFVSLEVSRIVSEYSSPKPKQGKGAQLPCSEPGPGLRRDGARTGDASP